MSYNINTSKESATPRKPVLLAEFTFLDGDVWRAATIDCTFGGHSYVAALSDQNIERLASLSEQGIDRIPSVSIQIADAAAAIYSDWERAALRGFRGATLLLRFALLDLITDEWSADSLVPFIGECDKPTIDQNGLSVNAQNKLNLAAAQIPQPPISERCIWINPATLAQRAEAGDADSRFYPCGEDRDLTTAPPCQLTRQTCTQSARFSGSQFQVAKQGEGREYISGNRVAWTNADTSGKLRKYWPQWLGGAAWIELPILNQWADGNYTRGEAAVGIGEIDVLRVIANGIELSQSGSGDYRWHYVNDGSRDGTANTDTGYADGDPYGGLTVIQFLAPHATLDPGSAATIRVLGQTKSSSASLAITAASATDGLIRIDFGTSAPADGPGDGALVTIAGNTWDAANISAVVRYLDSPVTDHVFLEGTFANGSGTGGTLYYKSNVIGSGGAAPTPTVLKDALKASGKFNDTSFGSTWAGAVAIASETIQRTDGNGVEVPQRRFTSAIALTERRSLTDIVRGLRMSIGARLYFGADGLLEIGIEGPLAEQQPAPVDGSNDDDPITSTLRDGSAADGYTAYAFDESNCKNLKSVSAGGNSTTPNRVVFPFSDPANDWAISTFSAVDPEDISRMDQETAGGLQVQPEGIASYNHAYRCSRLGLAKILRGNAEGDTRGTDWWQWETSFRACKLQVGQIVTLTDARLQLAAQQVRITSIKPSRNYEEVTITGHHHEDSWYADTPSTLADPERTFYRFVPPTISNGNVAPDAVTIDSVVADRSPIDGKRAIEIKYTPPDPIGPFGGVLVQIEAPDQSAVAPTPLDGSVPLDGSTGLGGPPKPQSFGPFDHATANGVLVVEIPEPDRTPMDCRARLISYSSAITNDAATAPTETFTVPRYIPLKPISGTAYCDNPATVTIPATFEDGTANPQIVNTGHSTTRLRVQMTYPDDTRCFGVQWIVKDASGETINASGIQAETDFVLVFATPAAVQTATVYACGADADGNINPLVIGITPSATVALGTAAGTVDLAKAKADSVGPSLAIIDSVFGVANGGITESLIDTFAVSAAKIAAGAVDATKIANLAVGTAHIANAAITTAKIANLAVTNALISDLAASKITSGTLAAGVVYAGLIAASQITAGTISASVSLTAPTLVITSGTRTINIDASSFIKLTDSGISSKVYFTPGGCVAQSTANAGIFSQISHDGTSGYAEVSDSSGNVTSLRAGTASSASAGAATLPLNPVGFFKVRVNGTIRNVPFYS